MQFSKDAASYPRRKSAQLHHHENLKKYIFFMNSYH